MTELRDGASSVSASMDPFADLNPGLASFTWRVVSLHMLTYILVGLVAFFALDYRSAFETTDLHYLMRPVNSPWVAAGPALQVFRGLLFAAVLYPLAPDILRRKNSVLLLWGLFVGFAILGTAGPSPGSLEGIIYTKLPISLQLMGLPEVVIQTLLFFTFKPIIPIYKGSEIYGLLLLSDSPGFGSISKGSIENNVF